MCHRPPGRRNAEGIKSPGLAQACECHAEEGRTERISASMWPYVERGSLSQRSQALGCPVHKCSEQATVLIIAVVGRRACIGSWSLTKTAAGAPEGMFSGADMLGLAVAAPSRRAAAGARGRAAPMTQSTQGGDTGGGGPAAGSSCVAWHLTCVSS